MAVTSYKNDTHHLLVSVKQSIIYLLLTPFIALAVVVWFSYYQINDFKNNQVNIATSLVNSVSQETARLIDDRKRLLNIFVANERENIKNLAADPGNDNLKEIIERKMTDYFPEYFTFTVVDQHGEPIIDDFDGFIGDICLLDIRTFVATTKQSIQVHPNPYIYHTDTIARIGKKKEDGYFFASFKTNVFSRLLKLSSPSDQSLMLINMQIPDLIEVTEDGARIVLDRNDYTLTRSEKQRTLYSMPVEGTDWRLASFHDERLFHDYNYEVISIGFIIVLIFFIGSILMSIALWRAEQQRTVLRKTRKEMFSLFSHDLRSPLNSISGTVQLLELNAQKHGFDDGTQRMISDAVANSEHMLSLINDLLDMQKLESGMMSFNYEKVELNAFIKYTIGLNIRSAEMQNVSIHFEPIDDLYVNIDKQRFQQVITNLLSNAIKYSPEGETVTVTLSLSKTSAVLTVADNGPGISDDIKDTVFDKFTQSKERMTKKVGGTGLGLSIVKYIVEEHGGYVGFKSEVGLGTQFIVKIPLNH